MIDAKLLSILISIVGFEKKNFNFALIIKFFDHPILIKLVTFLLQNKCQINALELRESATMSSFTPSLSITRFSPSIAKNGIFCLPLFTVITLLSPSSYHSLTHCLISCDSDFQWYDNFHRVNKKFT